jgi:hypothetical protein
MRVFRHVGPRSVVLPTITLVVVVLLVRLLVPVHSHGAGAAGVLSVVGGTVVVVLVAFWARQREARRTRTALVVLFELLVGVGSGVGVAGEVWRLQMRRRGGVEEIPGTLLDESGVERIREIEQAAATDLELYLEECGAEA